MTTTVEPSVQVKPSTVIAHLDKAPADVQMAVGFYNRASAAFHEVKTANGSVSKTVEQLAKQLANESTDEAVIALRNKIAKAQADLEAKFSTMATELKAKQGEPDKLAEATARKRLESFIMVLDTALTDNKLSRDDVTGHLTHPIPVKGQSAGSSNGTPNDTTAIREWAKDHGHDVGAKGRLSATVIDAYKAAHPE